MVQMDKIISIFLVLGVILSLSGVFPVFSVENTNNSLNSTNNTISNINSKYNDIIYVSPKGNNKNNGLTIDKPKKTIKNALKHVKNGGTIYIDSGTYKETLNIEKDVQLIGKGSNSTILDGNHKQTCITIIGFKKVLIEGLTITNGETWWDGGGIYNKEGRITIKNCIITKNRAYIKFISKGAGIYNHYGHMIIENSTIQNNGHVDFGGAISSYDGVLIIRDSIIQNNRCSFVGGGLYILGGVLVIENSLIQNNFSEYYAGAISAFKSDMTIKNCIFKDNRASKICNGILSTSTLIHLDNNTQFLYNNTVVEPDIF